MKKILAIATAVSAAILSVVCCSKSEPAPADPPKTPVFSISPASVTVDSGETAAIVISSDSDCIFTASSDNQNVAEVTVSGKTVTVSAKAVGTAKIKVDCPKTEKYAAAESEYCDVKVMNSTDLSADGLANCYIVSAAGDYKFCGGIPDVGPVGTPVSAETLWESFGTNVAPSEGDIVRNVSYSNGYVRFSTPQTLANGNAVIAVTDTAGAILWSWHIWVSEGFDPEATAIEYKNDAGTVMDRNLGATSATPGDVHSLGLLYEWGRKDPFLCGGTATSNPHAASTLEWPAPVSSNPKTGTYDYANANPTTYIALNKLNQDWLYSGTTEIDNTRWQPSDKDKGIYDPCPNGWRVPDGGSDGLWAKAFGSGDNFSQGPWVGASHGMDFGSGNGQTADRQLGTDDAIWYPATGYVINTGALYDTGHMASYWSASTSDNCAYFLFFFEDGRTDPAKLDYLSYGRSVRCVAE